MLELQYFGATVLLGALALANFNVYRSTLNPGFLFCLVWMSGVLAMFAFQPWFFPLREPTLLMFALGALALSMGSMVGIRLCTATARLDDVPSPPAPRNGAQVIINVLIASCLVAAPIFYEMYVDVGVAAAEIVSALPELRQQMNERGGGLPFDPVRNLPVLSFLVAVAAFHERAHSRFGNYRAALAILLAIGYGLATGSKAVLINLPVTLYLLACLGEKRLLVKTGASLLLVVTALFAIAIVFVNLSHLAEGNASEAILTAFGTIPAYFIGSMFAFDQVVSMPDRLEANQSVTRFFLETANSFGASFYVPNINAEWTVVSSLFSTNTYTMYFTYFMDGGWLGIVLLPIPVGIVLGWTFIKALKGASIAAIMFALLAKGIFLSIHSEQYFVALNWHLKSLLFLAVLYGIPPILSRILGATIAASKRPGHA
jgi:oligosaccharide repeat unit polymerase